MKLCESTPVYIGIGSNLENPLQQIEAAIAALRQLPDTQLVALSHIYQSAPVGPAGQPDYVNAAALLETTLTPESLLDALQAIEAQRGRVRDVRWGPRTLDLDIILFGRLTIHTPRLTVPHREMENRNFVLLPLSDISPELRLPDGKSLQSVTQAAGRTGISQLLSSAQLLARLDSRAGR